MVAALLLLVVVVLAVVGIRRAVGGERGPVTEAHAIRRFFQYLLLYGSLVVMAVTRNVADALRETPMTLPMNL